MRIRRLSDGGAGKSRLLAHLRVAERYGFRSSQTLSHVRKVAGDGERRLRSRFTLYRFFLLVTSAKEVLFSSSLVSVFVSRITQKPLD